MKAAQFEYRSLFDLDIPRDKTARVASARPSMLGAASFKTQSLRIVGSVESNGLRPASSSYATTASEY